MRQVLNFKNKKAVPQHCSNSYRESGLVQQGLARWLSGFLIALFMKPSRRDIPRSIRIPPAARFIASKSIFSDSPPGFLISTPTGTLISISQTFSCRS
jgi:hypothetical protein